MPDPKSDVQTARQILLATDKEDLVERIELLQSELQRRMDAEEEVLHQGLQRGTASLQAQVEEASRRFKAAQQELEAFRLEILRSEGDPAGSTPRPYIYEDLSRPPQEGPDRSELRGLLAAFRRLRDERDRLKREAEQVREDLVTERARAQKASSDLSSMGVVAADADVTLRRLRQEADAASAEAARLRKETDALRAEIERARAEGTRAVPSTAPAPARDSAEADRLRQEVHELEDQRDRLEQERADARADAERVRLELEAVRDAQARASEEATSLRAAARGQDEEADRLKHEVEELRVQAAAQVDEQAELGRRLAYEQAKSEQLAAEKLEVVNRLAETSRRLEEVKFELENPAQSVGFERLEAFFEKSRLKAHLEKAVRGPVRKDQPPAAQILPEILGAIIGAQEKPLEAARNLLPRIHRPSRPPGLGQMRQFIEDLKPVEIEGVRRVHDLLRQSFFTKKVELLTVDLDTTELILEQSPKPAVTYWPLVLYVPELQEFWHGELRTSPENAPKAIADFLDTAIGRAPATLEKPRLQVRMDDRFTSDPVLRVLEERKCSYVAAPPDSVELRAAARACAFSDAGDGWEAGEWSEKKGPVQVRYVTLRHSRSSRPMPALPPAFKDPQHAYQVFAVDRRIAPRRALEVFAGLTASEEREHALLRDVVTNRLLARATPAHASFLPLFLLAADLLQWYRRGLK